VAEPDPPKDPEPTPEPEAVEPKRDPLTAIGIDPTRSGMYMYIAPPSGWHFDRTVMYGGQRLEHVGEDGLGCWLYRWQ
jgi:hypothetical protein